MLHKSMKFHTKYLQSRQICIIDKLMRVNKNPDGTFVVEDEPMRLQGKSAREFLAQMRRRDVTGNDPEQQRFLKECERIYKTTKRTG